MTCPECGLAIPEGSSACSICGFAVDSAAVELADRRPALPKSRAAGRPTHVPAAAPVAPAAPAAPLPAAAPAAPAAPTRTPPATAVPEPSRAKRRRTRIGAFVRAIGGRLASAPGAFDRGLVRLLRYQWNVLPDSFEWHDRRVRAFVADAGRAAGKFVALSVWLPVRLALLLAVLALKATALLLFFTVILVLALIANA